MQQMPEPPTWREVTASWWALSDWQLWKVCQLHTWTFPPSAQVTECEVDMCREASGSHYHRPCLTCGRLLRQRVCVCTCVHLSPSPPDCAHSASTLVSLRTTSVFMQTCPECADADADMKPSWNCTTKRLCSLWCRSFTFKEGKKKKKKPHLTQWRCSRVPPAQNTVSWPRWTCRWI